MPEIRQLSQHVADMIAAGEVVERPASVVKELIENAADAGATVVTLEIRSGGMSYIRVTDNGCGMSPKDARTAFLRHATSKLRDERGLEAIGTLGFRGEALAAISSVSRVELLTREPDAPEGTRLVLEAGEVKHSSPAGCPVGTTIIVRDLFYNTPARLKFMKTDRAETAAVSSTALHIALSRPELSLRYIRDGQEEFHTAGDGSSASCIYSLLGRDAAQSMLKAEGSANGVTVKGYVCAPYAARGNRGMQLFFVNGRFIKSKTLQAALEQAYRNRLFTGKYPSCVLYITLSHAAVDVNVHPAKTEVRFLREKEVFDAVYYTVLGALDADGENADIGLSKSTQSLIGKPIVGGTRPLPTVEKPASPVPAKPAPTPAPERPTPVGHVSIPSGGFVSAKVGESFKPMGGGYLKRGSAMHESSPVRYDTSPQVSIPLPEEKPLPAAPAPGIPAPTAQAEPEQTVLPTEGKQPDWRIVGEVLDTYIVVEQKDGITLIDKHAAHERIIFDRLCRSREPVMTQPLLTPIIITPAPEDTALLLDNIDAINEFGFELDPFGADSVALRAVPADMDLRDAEGTLEMLCTELRQNSAQPNAARDAVLHTVACKAAIKAGRRSDEKELAVLAQAVMSGQVRYCPHGRPVAVSMTKYELDRQFKRA